MRNPLFGLALTCFALSAQTAQLTGRVTDPSGAVIAAAAVTARSTATNISTATETTSDGYYTLPSLAPGDYEVTVAKAGFVSTKQTGLSLAVGQIARLDVQLKIGGLAETIEVQARATLIESENAALGQVIGNRQVSELPLLGRNSYALAMLVPGVRNSFGVNNLVIDQISTVSYSINGGRANSNEFLLDGAPNSAASQNQPVINANPDMVQEFKVETNSFAAEYGRSTGGVFNVVTRSGTNDPHFSLYEFFRNDKLNANDWFANRGATARAPFKFNQFGGTFGGPVVLPKIYSGKNRTFFFFNTEIVRFLQGQTFTATLPDPRHLTGDFSNARLANGNLVTIFDPNSVAANPAGGFVRSAFAGNVVPASRIDPVARNVARLFPAPLVANAPLGTVNYTRAAANEVPKDSWSLRGDHVFNERNRMFSRYSYDNTPYNRAPVYGEALRHIAPTAGPQVFRRWNAVLEDTHTFSPTLLGTVRYSVTRLVNFRRPYSDNFNLESLGLPAYMRAGMVDPVSLPAIQLTGYVAQSSVPNIVTGGLIGATDLIRFGHPTHSLQGSVAKTLSSHTMKFGAEYRVIQFNNQQVGDAGTNFSFTPAWTQGPNPNLSSPTAGLSLATFLLGIPAGGVAPAPALAMTSKYYALYAQDSWKVTNKLTVNWGLRWEYEAPRTDRFDQLTNFDFQAASPLTGEGYAPRGGLTFVNTGGLPRQNANPDRNNFGPRLGIAYKLSPNTVLRAGGGLFYAGFTGVGGGAGPYGTSGFQANTAIVTSLDGITPVVRWSDPYPNGFNRPTGSSAGLSTLLGQSVGFFDRGNSAPKTAQWNFTLQRQFAGNMVVEAGYAGNRAFTLFEARQWNQLPASALAMGDALRQLVPNPFFGRVPVGPLAQRTVARAQLMRPFPQFDAVTGVNTSWANSNFHSLQTKFEKRYASGLNLLASHTWSKMMDYGTGPFAGEVVGASSFQNWNNLAAEFGTSTLDQTQRFILNAVYELPFQKGQKTAVAKVLGGWQIGAIWSAFSGGPLGISSAVNNTFSQGGGQRPNWNGSNPCVSNPVPARWLDSSVFSAPATYTFGNAPRTFNGCRSDRTDQVDMTLTKNTRFRERFHVQFRSEFFNVANSPRFAPPNQVFGNPQFGIVNAQGNLPRIIQFGLKLIY